MDSASGFVFILNNLKPDFNEYIEIIPRHIFRKANSEEIKSIKEVLHNLGTGSFDGFASPPYEIKWEKKIEGNGYSSSILPEKDWKYYVIAFQGTNSEIRELCYASSLIKNQLDLGFTFINIPGLGLGRQPHTGFPIRYYDYCNWLNRDTMTPINITKEELCLIKTYYDLIKKTPPDNFLYKAIRNFDTLKNIPRESDLLILGFFAIIESIITHEPRSKETLDSLNHQFTNKLILLRKRFVRQLNCSQYFQEGKEETIWKKLYSYRSCLAHGNVPDFSGEFKLLKDNQCCLAHGNVQDFFEELKLSKDNQSIFSFIHETLKLTIITALQELELVTDLRDC